MAGAVGGPHHDGSALYVSNERPGLGETVTVRVRVPRGWAPGGAMDAGAADAGARGAGTGVDAVWLRSTPDREPRWAQARRLGEADGWDWWEATLTAENPRTGYRWLLLGAAGAAGHGGRAWLNQGGLSTLEPLDAEDYALLATPAAPAWLAESVMYQVFPDRFARSAAADAQETPEWAIPAAWGDPVDAVMPGRSQQFYGGDLDGIREHLDHLVALGVDLLYLTPVFPAASNHRYDATSFDRVDPLLGGDEALARLVTAAHERGIRVIGDLTTNHTGDRHEWFRAGHGHPEAAEAAFYLFDDDADDYVSWLGVPSLPKLDWRSPELRRRFIEGPDSVVGRWLGPPFALDGWRIDVANMTGRHGAVDLNAEVRRGIRRTMLEANPDTVLLAESTNDAAADFQGDAWHGAMTYPSFTRPLWGWLSEEAGPAAPEPWFFGMPGGIPSLDGRDFVEQHLRFTAAYPWRIRIGNMNALDTHDTARFATHARPGAVPVALGLSLALPGVPVVFAGDEFGLTGADGEASRTPMPWGLPVLGAYPELIAARRAHPVLARGGMRWLHVGADAVVFVRESAEASVLVFASRAATSPLVRGVDAAGIGPGADAATAPDLIAAIGEVALTRADGALRLTAGGPAFAMWALPGIRTP
ncbi:glycoside hydrolase family 13 protein [Agromyces archimandritae]|uniref:glycoside hydrolase family 13 protein n=1 Tax=Agromyces archimandritae TaxID=2781962 RepID=UPI001FD5E8C5|nr:glycoside hydrolase family 13 protein [Agromyces archimandritae]